MSSLKVNNNIASYLKIFFERSNKLNNTVTSFGNVFKNSKWSDFQTQNIKKSFGKDWFLLAITPLLCLTLFYYFKFLPLVQVFVFVHVLKQMFFDVVYDFYYLLLYFFLQQSFFFQKSTQHTKQNPLTHLNQPTSELFTAAPVFGIQNVKTSPQMNSQVQLVLKTSKSLDLTAPSAAPTGSTTINQLLLQPNSSTTEGLLHNVNSVEYVLSDKLNVNFSGLINFSTQHNPSSVKFLNKNPYLNDYLTSQLLNSTKQYRWLTKNFLNTSNLTTNSHKITQSKLLISNNLLDTDKLKKNI